MQKYSHIGIIVIRRRIYPAKNGTLPVNRSKVDLNPATKLDTHRPDYVRTLTNRIQQPVSSSKFQYGKCVTHKKAKNKNRLDIDGSHRKKKRKQKKL